MFVINIALSSNKSKVNKPRKNEQSYTYTVHQYFTWKPNVGENHIMVFLISL
jgi:hypothetical protein